MQQGDICWTIIIAIAAILTALATSIYVIAFLYRRPRAELEMAARTDLGSEFYRLIDHDQNSNSRERIKETTLRFRVRIRNNGGEVAIVGKRYDVTVESETHTLRPRLPQSGKVYYGDGKDVYYGDKDGDWGPPQLAPAGDVDDHGDINVAHWEGWKTVDIDFKFPTKIPDETSQLKCELKIWDYEGHSAECKVPLVEHREVERDT